MKKARKGKYLSFDFDLIPRFSEVDTMGIVWHGNYLKYFEDAREAFGKKLGMSYMDVYDNGFMIPVVHSSLDYKLPIKYKDEIVVRIWIKYEVAAKIVNEFEIYNKTTDQLICTGKTTQVFIDLSGNLQFVKPSFFEDWEKNQDWIEL